MKKLDQPNWSLLINDILFVVLLTLSKYFTFNFILLSFKIIVHMQHIGC